MAPLHGLHLLTAWQPGQTLVPSVVPLGHRTESQHTGLCCSSWLSSEATWHPFPVFHWREADVPLRSEGREAKCQEGWELMLQHLWKA